MKKSQLAALVAGIALAAFTFGCNGENSNATNGNMGGTTNTRTNTNAGTTTTTNAQPPASNTSTTPSPTPTTEYEIDQEIKKLSNGIAGFNPPKQMNVGETRTITLILEPDESKEQELKDDLQRKVDQQAAQLPNSNIESTTRIETKKVLYSRSMEAHLTGQGFDIEPSEPQRQAVSETQNTEWHWNIKAREPGKQFLNLRLTAFIDVKGKEEKRALPVLSEVIEVETVKVPLLERIRIFISNNWQWLWVVIVAPLVPKAVAWFRRRKKPTD